MKVTAPPFQRIGLIGDIHAEFDFLEFALEYLVNEGIETVMATGDIVDGDGNVDGCCKLLVSHKVTAVRGNHERWFLSDYARGLPHATKRQDVSQEAIDFLSGLPITTTFDTASGPVLLAHGLGKHDTGTLRPSDDSSAIATNRPLQSLLSLPHCSIILHGHTHERMVRKINDTTFINAGTLLRETSPCFSIIDFQQKTVKFLDLDTSLSVSRVATHRFLRRSPMSKRPKHPNKKKSHSTIGEHQKQGKTLVPPLAALPGLQLRSWANDRLPEFLWAALLISRLGREDALKAFRAIISFLHESSWQISFDGSHSSIGNLDNANQGRFIDIVCQQPGARIALAPLANLDSLPSREIWTTALKAEYSEEHWKSLMAAVALTLDHQSQEATDCRWLRLMCMIAMGSFMLTAENNELAQELYGYPNVGEQRKVRPTIRAIEVSISGQDDLPSDWAAQFWAECQKETPCQPWFISTDAPEPKVGTTGAMVSAAISATIEHCNRTRQTTAVDARHDSAFGFSLYSLFVLSDLLKIGASDGPLGRMALRTLTEVFITFSHLARNDSPELWATYRSYGSGQAKLAFLKIEDLENSPGYVSADTLRQLANEDMWQEFQSISLGHWDNSNLRSMSENAGVKDVYDLFYSWTSGFVHGQWGAVRDTAYQTCSNPLHRLHRIPRESARTMNDVVSDACWLADRILAVLRGLYPGVTIKVSLPKP